MSNTDSDDSDNKIKKVRKTSIRNNSKFSEERKEIKQKLDKILGITETNDRFYMCDIDEVKQKEIEDMLEDIKKYYPCSECRWYTKGVDRLYVALIKYIYKCAKVELLHSQKTVERHGKKVYTGMYLVICA